MLFSCSIPCPASKVFIGFFSLQRVNILQKKKKSFLNLTISFLNIQTKENRKLDSFSIPIQFLLKALKRIALM